ncbi:50S ribosomal protein L29 [Candidatus Pacearchaeota archaeon]|jgi:ribosomal protein L29|nr:50S ribosomal protein L29 [Candidatus Pacearchaeota archaeon]|tara:strand:- start:12237 stop:12455 length:219 start_codon:yes stop_codon:yes gene_type:complete
MSILKAKEAINFSPQQRKEKLKELKLELVKANVTSQKTTSKTKEIKKAISRLLGSEKSDSIPPKKKEELKEK